MHRQNLGGQGSCRDADGLEGGRRKEGLRKPESVRERQRVQCPLQCSVSASVVQSTAGDRASSRINRAENRASERVDSGG
eukprot:2061191-Rhodomonas_salina.1